MTTTTRLDKAARILNWAAAAMLLLCLIMVFFFAPTELTMGNVHRILYFHVGTAWVSGIAFFVALAAGFLYLRRRQKKWDIISMASVEIGLTFATMMILSTRDGFHLGPAGLERLVGLGLAPSHWRDGDVALLRGLLHVARGY